MRILHNIPALQSYNALAKTNDQLAAAINRLSTGMRINSAADDAAGLAISEKMRSQVRGLDRATNNAQDAISMIQTAEGALGETHSMLQRMRELAVQAASDTLTQEDRSYLQIEIDQLREEITRISTTTQFNRKQLLDGSAGALWSTDNLETKVIVNGGLREIDRFGQKSAREGNFRITIDSMPGQAQMQKSDMFKIKHPNVIMDVTMNVGAGVQALRVDELPAGDYAVTYGTSWANAAPVQAYVAGGSAVGDIFDDTVFQPATWTGLGMQENQSILLEVAALDVMSNTVTFNVQIKGLTGDCVSTTHNASNFLVSDAGFSGTMTELGWNAVAAGQQGFKIKAGAAALLNVGDKFVFDVVLLNAGVDVGIAVSATLNEKWDEKWTDAAGAPATISSRFNIIADKAVDNEVHFQSFYVNTQNGTVYESDTVMSFSKSFVAPAANTPRAALATFEAAYIGQVAKGDAQLRDLDKFWDANGKFMLNEPQYLTLMQGDGTKATFTIYATDTLEDVRRKLNDSIANGLGQGRYSPESINNFVSFVEADKNLTPNSPTSVAGTFVIRSIIPGSDGNISFSGDENIIRAFALNTIQSATQSQFRVGVYDAHTGATIASSVKISGNTLYGIVAPNIDVRFDPMADIEAKWNPNTLKFDLISQSEEYSTIVHLSDNSTIFQIGANESEDMSVDIGDMGAYALGLHNINVSDRDNGAKALGIIDNAIGLVSKQRAKLGAYQNRLEYTVSNLTTASTNTAEAESRIRDVDMAREMMEFTKLNILSQAGNSMLAQANQLPNNVMALLQR